MAKSVLSSDTLPKAGRVNEVCREWLVHEDGALAYRLQDKEIKEHYSGNKVRNAQVREDLTRARVEQELETLKYQNYIHEQEERDAIVARQVALKLEKEERQKERELRDLMRLQLRLDDEIAQMEVQYEMQKKIQEEKDQELAKKLQDEEIQASDDPDGVQNNQLIFDHKIAMEAQDAELARMLQEKERLKVKRARERARLKKLERQQQQQHSQQQQEIESQNEIERPVRPDKLELKTNTEKLWSKSSQQDTKQYPDPDEIYVLNDSSEEVREVPNVATIIDPTYNGNPSSSSSSSNTVSPAYVLPTPPSELMNDDLACYMPVQGQRRSQNQFSSQSSEEKHKRRVKDGCKQQ